MQYQYPNRGAPVQAREDLEIGNRFALLWEVTVLFPEGDGTGAFIVPALDTRSNLFALPAPDLGVPGIPHGVLQQVIALEFAFSLARSLTLQDVTLPLHECGRPCDTLSCLFFTAPWLQKSQSILMQVQLTKDIDLTCY